MTLLYASVTAHCLHAVTNEFTYHILYDDNKSNQYCPSGTQKCGTHNPHSIICGQNSNVAYLDIGVMQPEREIHFV